MARHAPKKQFKMTQLCTFYVEGACTRGSSCNFAHTTQQLRDKPDLYKIRMCKDYMRSGVCANGDDCSFAHGQEEKRKITASAKREKTTLSPAEPRLAGPQKTERSTKEYGLRLRANELEVLQRQALMHMQMLVLRNQEAMASRLLPREAPRTFQDWQALILKDHIEKYQDHKKLSESAGSESTDISSQHRMMGRQNSDASRVSWASTHTVSVKNTFIHIEAVPSSPLKRSMSF